jgi:anaerobic selenocysteine-containing dehydrogenase
MLEVYNSTGDHLPRLRKRWPYNPAFLCAQDLRALGVESGEVVRIDSEHDFVYAVAEECSDLRSGTISLAHARGGSPSLDGDVKHVGCNTGRLVSCECDFEPISGIPRQSAIPVNVRRLSEDELRAIA